MHEFKGRGWFKINDKLVLMISDDIKYMPELYCHCDVILCSDKIAKKYGNKFKKSGATIISLG